MAVAALLAVLVLQPVLAEPGPLRLVAVGTGTETVEWLVDGTVVATTLDGVPAAVNATAGMHTVVARTAYQASWSALVRSEPSGPGIQYVPAWTAHWDAEENRSDATRPAWLAPGIAGAAALAAILAGWRLRRNRRASE